MPNRICPHPTVRRPRLFALALGVVALLGLAAATTAASRPRPLPPGVEVVHGGTPYACVAFYGPGPCRPHWPPHFGSTDAVAIWPMPDEDRPAAPGRAHQSGAPR